MEGVWMTKFITLTLALLVLFTAGVAGAQENASDDRLRVGEFVIDWPLVGWQTKTEFLGGLFLGIGGHVNLIPLGDRGGIGVGAAFTLTGEKRLQAEWYSWDPEPRYNNGYYNWLGRTALAVTVPFTFKCEKQESFCTTLTPLYEIRRFNWTPGYVDTESRSLGLAINASFWL